jgi:hypothetical protein
MYRGNKDYHINKDGSQFHKSASHTRTPCFLIIFKPEYKQHKQDYYRDDEQDSYKPAGFSLIHFCKTSHVILTTNCLPITQLRGTVL